MRSLSLLFFCIISQQAYGAGFGLSEQNASGLGNAFAGAAAVAENASTIYSNPAGMVYLKGQQLSVAIHAIDPSSSFHNNNSVKAGAASLGDEGGDIGDLALIPNIYYSQQINPSLFMGIGVNTPFGLKTEYDSQWMGRFQALKSELKTININPAIAYQVNDKLAIGAGISAMWAQAELTKAINIGSNNTVKVKGDDWGFGFNLGAIYQATPDTRLGLAYRSEVRQKLDGTSTSTFHLVDAIPTSTLNTGITADLTLPASLSISALSHLNAKWDIMADVTWTGWSKFQELKVVRDNGSLLNGTSENWHDTMRYSLGASYQYNEKLKLRTGVAFDEEAIDDQYRTARIPGNDRTWLALGASWQAFERGTIDIGYAHIFIKDASVNEKHNAESPPSGDLIGQYQGQVDILSVQYTHQF
jgi:long-chain fatty acid transport protein